MTPPDRLVQAATEAMPLGIVLTSGKREFIARQALAAAFAALPECEEVWSPRPNDEMWAFYNQGWYAALDRIAALARELEALG